MRISERGLELLKTWEKFRADIYDDSAGNPTIGWGHKIIKGDVRFSKPLGKSEASVLLMHDVRKREKFLDGVVKVLLKQHEYDALVVFVYNIGRGAFKRSTLLEVLNHNDKHRVPSEMLRWVYAGGRPSKGLARRRLATATMFVS